MRMKLPAEIGALISASRNWTRTARKIIDAAAPVVVARPEPKRRPAARTTSDTQRPALKRVAEFGSNPGDLAMYEYVPADLPAHAPLVVVLHGCLQRAEAFSHASGWTALARQKRFAVVFPEQTAGNNRNYCFNWFRPSAVARDRGELMSIRQMIDDVRRRHSISPDRIFVQGLSAGGAMASALLATYPDLFAGGHIVGGLPFGAAREAMTALSVMKSGAKRNPREWGDLVRAVTPELPRRPRIAIWHGTDDHVVNIVNAYASLNQWQDVYGLRSEDSRELTVGREKGLAWRDEDGRCLLEFLPIRDMDHGMPVGRLPAGLSQDDRAFMLNVGLNAPAYIAEHWLDAPRA